LDPHAKQHDLRAQCRAWTELELAGNADAAVRCERLVRRKSIRLVVDPRAESGCHLADGNTVLRDRHYLQRLATWSFLSHEERRLIAAALLMAILTHRI
jgi:hypothetical protein